MKKKKGTKPIQNVEFLDKNEIFFIHESFTESEGYICDQKKS